MPAPPTPARATHVERFAPSPNGLLHLGHAFSAITAHDAARAAGGAFLLRIEDVDAARAMPAFEAAIFEDLAWLDLRWEEPVLRQSSRGPAYAAALAALAARGLIYPCTCTRRDIAEAASAPQETSPGLPPGPAGPDGLPYPGTCRPSAAPGVRDAAPQAPGAIRLDIAAAIAALGGSQAVRTLGFTELDAGPAGEHGPQPLDPDWLIHHCGDPVLARRDGGAAYHLAVVVDDAHQHVSHVTRGRDLFTATPLHRLLQALLGLPTPLYRHHRLIRDAAGRRLAKRDRDAGLAAFRAAGATPADLRARLHLPPAPG